MDKVDCTVIGGGVIGLAVAARLSVNREVMLLEKEPLLGQGVSSRHSEVIHSGIYYPADSLKAQSCVAGREALYRFCDTHKVPFKKTGKLVVARYEHLAGLEKLLGQAQSNGVSGCRILGKAETSQFEPALEVAVAMYCPDSGIIDSHAYMQALSGQISANGSSIAVASDVSGLLYDGEGYRLQLLDGYQFQTRQLVIAAGLQSWKLAEKLFAASDIDHCLPERYLAKGHYFSYSGKSPFSHLVYPLPEQGGLGIHATLDLAGQLRFGPDVQYTREENYNFPQDVTALQEKFVQAIRSYFPGLDPARLQPAYCGIRPKLQGPEDDFADFLLLGKSEHGLDGLAVCLGIESPGLTASLALAENVEKILHA